MDKVVNKVDIVMAILLFFVIVITLGYSAFVDSLSVSNTVVKIRPQENTRISAV